MATGISARDLSDDDLRRELAQLKKTAQDIDPGGTSAQQANHRTRTEELEAEFLRRNPPASTGARADGTSAEGYPSGDGTGDDDDAPAGPNEGPVDDQPNP